MQPLHQCDALGGGEMRQYIHTEDAVEPSNIGGGNQIHGRKRDQVAQPGLHQEMLANFSEISLHQLA